jgi:hypothetical protein
MSLSKSAALVRSETTPICAYRGQQVKGLKWKWTHHKVAEDEFRVVRLTLNQLRARVGERIGEKTIDGSEEEM